jgi:radical SAM superfamily enzyme YgiQ (UPF0313 family)
MKKILLINPKSGYANFTFNEPLVMGVLAALTPDNYEIEFIDENFETFEYIHCDLVAITSITSTINRAYAIAEQYNENGIPTIIGGIHASHLPEEVSKYFTSVVMGDSEGVWQNLLNDFENNSLKKVYRNLDYRTRHIVAPKRSIFKKYNYGAASIETSRGCSNTCEYCSIHSLFEHRRYKRPVEDIVAEIENIDKKVIFFTDDNFIGNFQDKERIEIILNVLTKYKKKWAAFCTLDIVKHPDLLELFKKSGCIILYIGIETDKIDTLTTINKSVNERILQQLSLKDCLNIIHTYSISVMGFLIFGFDTDQSIDEMHYRLKRINKSGLDWFVIFILTPVPGSQILKNLNEENRIVKNHYPQDWAYYNFINCVFSPKNFSDDKLDKFFIETNTYYYNRKNTFKRFIRTLINTRSLKNTAYLYIWVISNWNNIRNYWFMKIFRILAKPLNR